MAQQESYPDEIAAVTKGRPLERRVPLVSLTPQIGDDQLKRICGRLGPTDPPYGVKHPIILSRHTKLAKQLAEEAHLVLGHAGVHVQPCTQVLRNEFRIVGVQVLLRNLVKNCTTCMRCREKMGQQFMADVPRKRLEIAPVFRVNWRRLRRPDIVEAHPKHIDKGMDHCMHLHAL